MADAYFYQGDERPYFRVTLERGGSAIDVEAAAAINFKMYRKDREAYESPVVSGAAQKVNTGSDGIVEYQWATDDLADLYGRFSAAFVVDWGGGTNDEGIPDGDFIEVVVRPLAT